jgi:hypothetical protein
MLYISKMVILDFEEPNFQTHMYSLENLHWKILDVYNHIIQYIYIISIYIPLDIYIE